MVADDFLQKGEYQRALAAFNEADKLRPFDSDIYDGRVKALAFFDTIRGTDLDSAEVQCKVLIKRDQNNAEAYKFLGIVYAKKGNYAAAEEAFKNAIQVKGGKYREAEYNLAKLYAEWAKTFSRLSQHGLNQRVSYLQKAIQTNNELLKRETDTRAMYNTACDHALLNEPDNAIRTLEAAFSKGYDRYEVIAGDSDLDGIRRDSRFRRLISDRYSEVMIKYQALIESGQVAPDNFHVLAWIQLFSNGPEKIKDGIESAKRALAVQPNEAAYLGTLAELYATAGDYKLANEKIKMAIDKDPSRPYYLGLRDSWIKKPGSRSPGKRRDAR